MSLKFGIYLVEQRIISPEQFCGLVKIQQEATMSLASVAIRRNFMTIKQVSRVLDIVDANPQLSFIQAAVVEDLIDVADADQMVHEQQMSCPSIQKLIVECGLLTQRQSEVLCQHFEKLAKKDSTVTTSPETATAPRTPAPKAAESQPRVGPRQPKFTQRPVVATSASHAGPFQ